MPNVDTAVPAAFTIKCLASTPDTGSIEDLAQLAGKIMEAAVPSVVNGTTYLHEIATAPPRSN